MEARGRPSGGLERLRRSRWTLFMAAAGRPTAESKAGSSSLATLAPPRPPEQTAEMAQQVARGGAAETLAAGTSLAPTVVATLGPPMG